MAHKKGLGSSSNGRDSQAKRLGVKCFGGERVTAGSIIVIVSDFYDLKNNMLGTLHTLASNHTVIAKHIIDPMEQSLPEHGKYQVTSHQNIDIVTLDCDDTTLRHQYQLKMTRQQENIEKLLTQTGVNYQLCLSDEDIINESQYE